MLKFETHINIAHFWHQQAKIISIFSQMIPVANRLQINNKYDKIYDVGPCTIERVITRVKERLSPTLVN